MLISDGKGNPLGELVDPLDDRPMPEVSEEQIERLQGLAGPYDPRFSYQTNLMASEREALRALLADHAAGKEREKKLRRLLFLQHPCAGKYGDDGEMQCSACRVDFLRDDPGAIESQLVRVAQAALAETPDAADTTSRVVPVQPNDSTQQSYPIKADLPDDPGLATKEGKPQR